MTAARCAICDKPLTGAKDETGRNYTPFCSKRCADVDLQRWFTGGYAIPVRDDEPTDDEGEGPARQD